eukprot:14285480-Alexandrium_andersonii.AAC.1
MPDWIIRCLWSLVSERAVRAAGEGDLGPIRALARSIGMGGPASPLLWALAYDPVIVGTSDTARAPTPTCVDD